MSTLNPGDIAITIDGRDYVLKPTLRALDAISTQFGGLTKARDALIAQDFNGTVAIVRHALNLTPAQLTQMREAIFNNGLTTELIVPLMNYTGILANGGKPLPNAPVEASAEGNG